MITSFVPIDVRPPVYDPELRRIAFPFALRLAAEYGAAIGAGLYPKIVLPETAL